MSGGGGKGGSQTTKMEIPKWMEEPAKRNLARAEEISQIGYVPYIGPDVAAFTPSQEAAFANNNSAASAFGMGGGASAMPAAETFAGGIRGYSSYPLYQESLAALQAANPGQYDAIASQFIDPVTGSPSSGVSGGTGQAPQRMSFMEQLSALRSGQMPSNWTYRGASGDGGGNYSVSGGGSGGGYTGLRDMVNGGGPGASGDRYQGGGRISDVGNAMGGPGGK